MRLRLLGTRGFVASTAVLSACSLTTSLDGLTGGGGVVVLVDGKDSSVTETKPRSTIVVSPATVTLEPGGFVQLSATVSPPGSVTWSVQEGAAGGSVNEGGAYAAPYAAGTFHIVATTDDGARASIAATVPASITLLAGRADGYVNGLGKDARFRTPSGSAVDAEGNVYVSERANHTIRKITAAGVVSTFAGRAGVAGSDDGVGESATFYAPNGTAVDADGNVYVADGGNRTVRKISKAGVVTTLAGKAGAFGDDDLPGPAARFRSISGIAADPTGTVYVTDYSACVVRKITPGGDVSTFAGTPGSAGSANGTGAAAAFSYPEGIAVSATTGLVYVADSGNHTVRTITQAGVVATLAGAAGTTGATNGQGTNARFYYPSGVAVDTAGTVYVADLYNNLVRKISAGGNVSTLAGGGGRGQVDGLIAGFAYPSRVSVDTDGNLFVTETVGQTVRKITPSGVVSTFAGRFTLGDDDGEGAAASFRSLNGIAVDASGNAFVGDYSATRKITPRGRVTTFAGKKGFAGNSNGTAADARFNNLAGLVFDAAGGLFVTDASNNVVRKVDAAGAVSTFAGVGGSAGDADGRGAAARFSYPKGIAVDATGLMYVTDWNNHTIRALTPEGTVSTLAGRAGEPGTADGRGTDARFRYPGGVAIEASGSLVVADSYNHTLRRIDRLGAVTTPVGTSGTRGYSDGKNSLFFYPWVIAADAKGNVFVGENGNRDVRRVYDGRASTIVGNANGGDFTELGALPGTLRLVTGVAVQPSGTLLVTTEFAVYRVVGAF